MENYFYTLTTVAILIGTLPICIGSIFVLKAGRKLAGWLMLVGSVLLAGEMSFYVLETIFSLVRSGDPLMFELSEGLYFFVAGTGVLGTMAIGAGVLLLGFQLAAVVKENKALREMAGRHES